MDLSSFKEILDKVLNTSGPWAALFVLAVWRHLRYVERMTAERLRDKDSEIERLVGQRNRLEEIVLAKRKSSGQ
jgi:hypothetical protein